LPGRVTFQGGLELIGVGSACVEAVETGRSTPGVAFFATPGFHM